MKILATLDLTPRHCEEIQSSVDNVEILQASSLDDAERLIPEVEILIGEFSPELFGRAKNLRWVQTWGAGVDGLLFKEFVESEIILTSAKGTVGVHLAEHAMALLLSLSRGITQAVRGPQWGNRMLIRQASWELIGKTLGIIGMGGTGLDVAKRANAFGMRIIAVDPEDVQLPNYVSWCRRMDAFHNLLGESDVVVICAPLTRETERMFNHAAFNVMRAQAFLINVTRGKIVDEDALMEALRRQKIGGAGLDVTPQEPLPDGHPLWQMSNVIITPHTAGGSPNRDDRLVDLFCQNLKRYMAGEPLLSVIDKRKEY
ncbi:MAG: Hydroxypyruvate reductase [Candidatus Moanabacter tarae]|uniref:Hydroxypyruvate reductase n=1 Tax=Candidatus Moanibacter tarae TaxID=2200854 RepID=A0A2Z4AB54_9BACT|nr:MAG: Hydroxypyruvate reductase [Candidatus Moanabacter tarae]|tara:strand:- start:10408 stop:11352 length:945 start_codon:yes stop_codon:yes gene_type:complete